MTLLEYYQVNNSLVENHKYSNSDIEAMYPYERDLIVDIIQRKAESEPKNPDQPFEAPED